MKMIVTKGVIDTGEGIYSPGDEFDAGETDVDRLQRLGVAKPVAGTDTESGGPTLTDAVKAAVGAAVEAKETTKDGRPTVEALESRLNRNLSSAERDEIWDEYNECLTA